jgi:hypothetical protein
VGRFVFVYAGGGPMGATEEEQQKMMHEWGLWFGSIGDQGEAVVDPGTPLGTSSTVTSAGVTEGGAPAISGYSIIAAESLEDACKAANGCPVLAAGGSVHVYEAMPMP